jgi:ABC-type amino acid transport substrate-binding protein
VLCIGAAAISITAEREQQIDFLPTYYMAGLQIMAPVVASVDFVIATVAGNIARQLGLILLFVLWLAVTMTPIVWILEMRYAPPGALPIFFVSDAEVEKDAERSRKAGCTCRGMLGVFLPYRMRASFFKALQWSLFTYSGDDLKAPKSVAVNCRSLAKFIHAMTLIILTGTSAAIFSGYEHDGIKTYSDLRGKTVCTTRLVRSHRRRRVHESRSGSAFYTVDHVLVVLNYVKAFTATDSYFAPPSSSRARRQSGSMRLCRASAKPS